MVAGSAYIVPLGIFCGIVITFSYRLLFYKGNSNLTTNFSDSTNQNDLTSSLYLRRNDSISELENERNSLLSRLSRIDQVLKSAKPTQSQLPTVPREKIAEKSKAETSLVLDAPVVRRAATSHPKAVNSLRKGCKYDFTVFVYPLPTTLLSIRISEEARYNRTLHVCQKCIFEQFALEYIMYDFFSQFCGRTWNPEEADFFYLPIVRDAEYRMALESRGPRARAPSSTEQALLNIIEKNNSDLWHSVFQYSDKFWQRKQGGDHIIVMPAPVTNLRHESSQRGYFHYMSHLNRPIFLAVEYSIQFMKDYPICAGKKNIIVPYPTTDPELYNGKLLSLKAERKYLLYYAGGLHGDCIETRRAMMVLMRNSTKLTNVIPKVRNGLAERENGFLLSTFCPVPIGDSPSSKRMYDVLNFGCIPVVLSDDLVWAFSDQSGGPMIHTDFAIQIPQSVVQYSRERSLRKYANRKDLFGTLPVSKLLLYDLLNEPGSEYENGQYINPLVHLLRKIPAEDIDYLHRHGKIAAANYRFYAMNISMNTIPTAQHIMPDGGAIDQITLALSQRKLYGIEKLSTDCQYERKELKHTYQSRYSCDNDKVDSLIAKNKG